MNVPNDKIETIGKILPVLKSLTVMPLAEEGWSSVHSVIDKDTFYNTILSIGQTKIPSAPASLSWSITSQKLSLSITE